MTHGNGVRGGVGVEGKKIWDSKKKERKGEKKERRELMMIK